MRNGLDRRAWRCGLLAALVTTGMSGVAEARPADVIVRNGPANPASVEIVGTPSVRIDSSGNDVDVNSSSAAPVYTRESSQAFGASLNLTAYNGTTSCDKFAVPTGRTVMLSTMVVGLSGPATPRAWLDFYSEKFQGYALKQELEIPVRESHTALFRWTGQLQTGFPIVGGGTFDGDGVPTDVRGCIRAAASGTTQANVMIAGTLIG